MDFSAQLHELSRLTSQPALLDELLSGALLSLRQVISYDLAVLYRLDGDILRAVVAEGPLASPAVRRHTLRLTSFASIRRAFVLRRPVALDASVHESEEGDPYDGVLDLPHGHSCMVVPLFAGDRNLGIITLDRSTCGVYPPEGVELAGVLGQLVSTAFVFAEQSTILDRYRHRLREHVALLEGEHTDGVDAVRALESSVVPSMKQIVQQLRVAAGSDAPILLLGETGVGKEVFARAVHAWSPRSPAPFVRINCAAIPESLVESELFGHVRGAFSGAHRDRQGRFATADGGTLLLDELGEMPLATQARLLRVLQEGTFEPVGSDRTVHVDVRVIGATNVNLLDAVRQGRFREDLYYRLAVFPVDIPPLRARRDDILAIAAQWLEGLSRRTGRGPWELSPEAESYLLSAPWPGNVRQLVNLLERATILCSRGTLGLTHFGLSDAPVAPTLQPVTDALVETFEENEVRYLRRLLAETNGRIYGAGGAAERAGMKPTTLQSRLKMRGIR